MANKNHTLDSFIIDAARKEFLENGFQKASMRKIAADANVTIGAIYTRYATKDILFCSLVQPLIRQIEEVFSGIKTAFNNQLVPSDHTMFVETMQKESDFILHILFDDYDSAVLLLCRSHGSSLEHFMDIVIQRKIEETISFFRNSGLPHPDSKVLKLLINGQFHMYFQIINEGYNLEDAQEMMHAAMIYHTGGWRALLGI